MSALELRVPPPVVALVAAGLMALAARFAPGFVFDVPGGAVLAAAVAAAGLAFDAAALVAFVRARTTINPTKPGSTSSIVTGPVLPTRTSGSRLAASRASMSSRDT